MPKRKKTNVDNNNLIGETSNFKVKCINASVWILGVISPTIALIWFVGMISEIAKSFNGHDYSFFMRYAEISLTLFGFTLIGAIFEKKNLNQSPVILKRLFVSSLTFLASAISFLFLYSAMYIPIEMLPKFASYIVIGLVFLFAITGFIGFLMGLLSLFPILLEHLKEYYIKEEVNKPKQEIMKLPTTTSKLDKFDTKKRYEDLSYFITSIITGLSVSFFIILWTTNYVFNNTLLKKILLSLDLVICSIFIYLLIYLTYSRRCIKFIVDYTHKLIVKTGWRLFMVLFLILIILYNLYLIYLIFFV